MLLAPSERNKCVTVKTEQKNLPIFKVQEKAIKQGHTVDIDSSAHNVQERQVINIINKQI